MGLLDSVIGAMGSGQTGGGEGGASLMKLAPLVLQLLQGDGLQQLVQKFQQGGLGDVVMSWISNGPNMPVSGDQLGGVLGSGTVDAMSASTGLPQGDVLGGLAQLLPTLINQFTPEGQVPDQGLPAADNMAGALGGLGNLGDMGKMLGGLLGR